MEAGKTGSQLARRLQTLKYSARPDQVTAHYSDGARRQLRLGLISAAEEGLKPLVLIEGTSDDLLFLADVLIAQAEDELDCGFQLTAGAGGFFRDDTEAGLYIHLLPCSQEGSDEAVDPVDCPHG